MIPRSLPITDWQFWVATAVFLAAAAWLFRGVLPLPGRWKKAKGSKRVPLTIGGKHAAKPAPDCERCGE